MHQLQAIQLEHAFGGNVILSNVGLSLQSGDRIALTGANGSGKTSLMKILAGLLTPDSGTIHLSKGSSISYLPQEGVALHNHSIKEEAESVFAPIEKLIQERDAIAAAMAEGNNKPQNLAEYGALQDRIENSTYYQRESIIESTLIGLGFSSSDLQRPCSEFSGGWRMRIALAKILIEQPDFLLLDEPTNYLDIEARHWLEGWMQRYKGAILLTAHDRFFLDTTMNGIIEVFHGTLKEYRGSYSSYEQERTEELARLHSNFNQQQKEISKHEDFIRKFRYNARKAKQVQSRIKMLEKIDPIELPSHLIPVSIPMPPVPHCGKDVLAISGLSKKYGDNTVFQNIDFHVSKGERIVLTGKNGSGKTSLLRIIAGKDSQTSGAIQTGTGVSIGYFEQEAAYTLPPEETILSYLENIAPADRIPDLRNLAGAFLFRGDDIYKQLAVLSGGERSRLALLATLLKPVNLLLLDEPTNHLDIVSQDVLAEAINRFDGTAIIVSHDEDFLYRVADRVLELHNGSCRNFPGDYEYYKDRLERENTDNKEMPEPIQKKAYSQTKNQDFALQKERRSRLQKLEKREASIVQELETLQANKQEVEKDLALPENYSNGERVQKLQQSLQEIDQHIESLSQEWEDIDSQLQSLTD